MNKLLKFTILFLIVFTSLITAQVKENIKNADEKSSAEKINSTEATDDQILFKNETGNPILTITDEGNNAGSVTLPPLSSIGTSSNKLYNIGGSLYWNGSALGTSGSAGGWTDAGSVIYNTALTDKVGIGTSTPQSLLSVGSNGNSGTTIYGLSSNSGGYAIAGIASGGSGHGVYGEASNAGEETNYAGYFNCLGPNGYGVYSLGLSRGVYGKASSTTGGANYGGYFSAAGTNGRGVHGEATNIGDVYNYGGYFISSGEKGAGVFASGLNKGIYAEASKTNNAINYGGYFVAKGDFGYGLYSSAPYYGSYSVASNNDGIGVYGEAPLAGGNFSATGPSGKGVIGEVTGSSGSAFFGWANNAGDVQNYGGQFQADGNHGVGVAGVGMGENSCGVYGLEVGTSGRAIYGQAYFSTAYAGYFSGKVYISGVLEKPAGSFKIDHPLDPMNKCLFHSFVESPDMMNIYNGNIVTDLIGNANIQLPDWFEALNKDFRYQLTVIGEFAQAIVSEEISNNQFSIKTNKPNVKVSWQVTGIRHDAYANSNRIKVEEMKPEKDRGKYLQPEAFNMPKNMGVDYNERIKADRTMRVE